MTDELVAKHIFIEKEEDLKLFRNSKYVQSKVGDSYKKAKEFLEQDRWVCFSGTPCQIEGLINFLGKKYEKLITVDVVCRAVPSPLILSKYLEFQKEMHKENATNVRFRDKYYGYQYSTLNINGKNKKWNYHRGVESDPWLRAFFSNICNRPSCYECQFKKRDRVSDFTIWDCFRVWKFTKEIDVNKGATKVLVHTEKGKMVFDDICSTIKYVEVDADELTKDAKEMIKSVPRNPNRENFFKDANLMNGNELFEKYFPINLKLNIKYYFRVFAIKTGIYKTLKKIQAFIKNRK